MSKTTTEALIIALCQDIDEMVKRYNQSITLVPQTINQADLSESLKSVLDRLRDKGGVCSLGILVFHYKHNPLTIEQLANKGLIVIEEN